MLERKKGLRSLIPDGTVSGGAEGEREVVEVGVEELRPSPFQPRRRVGEEGMEELVESVKAHGILQPLVARWSEGRLELIAGERRLEAAKRAGMEKVPVVVREASDREALELALVENLQREDINPMEAAMAYRRLMDEFGMTQAQVAERVGKSRPAVANALRLLRLPLAIQESLRNGHIDEGHAKVLAGIEDRKAAVRLWRRIVRHGLSVRATEEAAAKLQGREVPRGTLLGLPKSAPLDPNLQDLQERLTMKLGARVRIRPRGEGGYIEIPYADANDLDRIFWDIVR